MSSPTSSFTCKPQSASPVSIAGIAISTAIIGAVTAGLTVWFVLRKRYSRRAYTAVRPIALVNPEPRVEAPSIPLITLNPPDSPVLDRTDDSLIRNSMQNLTEVVEQHCLNNYHLRNVITNQTSEAALHETLLTHGYGILAYLAIPVADIPRLLFDPRSRRATIRQLIMMVALSKTVRYIVPVRFVRSYNLMGAESSGLCPRAPASRLFSLSRNHKKQATEPFEANRRNSIGKRIPACMSLLPPPISTFCKSIAPIQRRAGAADIFHKNFTQWRYLSAFLLNPFRSSSRQAPPANKAELDTAIRNNISMINAVLGGFIKPGAEAKQNQERGLFAILFGAAELGLTLFSQPREWGFSWPEEKSGSGDPAGRGIGRSLVVSPALSEKMGDLGKANFRRVVDAVYVKV